MKAFKIAIIVLVSLFVLVIAGAFIFIKTFDVNKHLPQITAQASKAMGRELSVGRADLGISLAQGVSLKISDIVLADDPVFSAAPFVSVGHINVGVNIGALLFQGKVRMTEIVVDGLKAVVIRSKEGLVNAATLGGQGAGVKAEDNKAVALVPALLVNDLKITNASVTYVDASFTPQLALTVDHIDVRVNGFSLTSPFDITGKMALFSAQQNVSFKGRASLDVAGQAVRVRDVAVDADLAAIVASVVDEQLSMLRPLALKELGGVLHLMAADVKAGAKGIEGLQAGARLDKGLVVAGAVPVPVSDISFAADIDAQKVDVTSFSAAVADGVVRGNALIMQYMTAPVVGATVNIEQVDLKKIVDALKAPVNMSGMFFASGNIKFSGKTPEEVMASLSGDVKGELKDGVLHDVNLLALGLGKIPMMPGLLESVMADLPEAAREDVRKGITHFEACRIQGNISEGVFHIDTSEMTTPELQAQLKGAIALAGTIDATADIRVQAALSEKLARSAQDLGALKDEQGRIYVPVNIKGPLAGPSVMPDAAYLAQKLLAARGGEQLQKVLGTPEAAAAVNAVFDLFKKK